MLKHSEATRRAVRQALAGKGKTQRWLAKEVGITESALSNILRGRNLPSLETAVEIARITRVPVQSFVNAAGR